MKYKVLGLWGDDDVILKGLISKEIIFLKEKASPENNAETREIIKSLEGILERI